MGEKFGVEGCQHLPQYLSLGQQTELVSVIREGVRAAPLFRPVMPGSGQAFSVRMSSFGARGWVSDKSGYRYQKTHPTTRQPWPRIPDPILDIWRAVQPADIAPDTCLVNFYEPSARMGLHRDEDEETFAYPIVSVSLGMAATFELGGLARRDPKKSLRLRSGDVLVLGGESRLAYHSVPRLLKSEPNPLGIEGRINLTLRRVSEPEPR